MLDELPQESEAMSVNEVAELLAELFEDNCACNYDGIDEWLPYYCEVPGTVCPHPCGVECWKQFLKWRDVRASKEASG